MEEITGEHAYYSVNYVRQGWQCPICKKVLAPFMSYCPFCPEDSKWTSTSSIGTMKENKDD